MLVDFGVSSVIPFGEIDILTQTEGTTHCFAPEVCDPEVDSYSGKPVDVWALGVSLYCMAFNRLPYLGNTAYFVMENIRT